MKFFADEGLDCGVVELLREKGYTVIYAAENYVAAPDDALLQRAYEQNCIFIKKDKDFDELVIRKNKASAGVVLVRIEQLNLPQNCALVAHLIQQHINELWGSFPVIQEDNIRIRPL